MNRVPSRQSHALARDESFIAAVARGDDKTELLESFPSFKPTIIHEARGIVQFFEQAGMDPRDLGHKPLTPLQQHREELRNAVLSPPVNGGPISDRERGLECEIAKLRSQLTWSDHADPSSRQGGTFTLNHSDDHFCDRAHLIDCHNDLVEKSLILMHLYEPRRILLVSNGDKVAGSGVYKEQNRDTVVPMTTQQLDVAAWKVIRMDRRVKEEFPKASVEWHFTHGNHDIDRGERLTPALVLRIRAFGAKAMYHGDEAIINLADRGVYNAFFTHGTGYSDVSPSSPRWLSNMKDTLLRLSLDYYAENRIRRVSHGHTHWYSLNMERVPGVYYDTTGGTQRNERVLLGKNERPMGWIAYVSPEGYESILDPIGIQPEDATKNRELRDPWLLNRNMTDCSSALKNYAELEISEGLRAGGGPSPEGR